MTEGPAYFEYEDLLLKYHVSMEGVLAPPKAIASSLSESLFGEDITLFADIEETDEQYELAIEALKKSAQDSRIAMIGDVNILYFHLEMNADEMYRKFKPVNLSINVILFPRNHKMQTTNNKFQITHTFRTRLT